MEPRIKQIKLFKYLSWIIVLVNLCLNLSFISKEKLSNEYYSAAVKSMLLSFKNFFFASFDPAGFMTVDKPPLGLWLQVLSVKFFGFNTFGLLFPSIISSAIVCWIIYKIMSDSFGEIYGLLAEVIFCFTPIVIAVSRTNNLDMTLMLFMSLAIYFTVKSCKQKKFCFFILAMIMLGLAFNIKMFQAYMIAPAIFIYFMFYNKISRKTFVNCTTAGIVLLTVSFSWTIITELTPESERPFIGGSESDNSVLTLMFEHNGFERLTDRKNNRFGTKINQKNADGHEPPAINLGRNSTYKFSRDNFDSHYNLPKDSIKNKISPSQNPFGKSNGGIDEIGNPGLFRLFDLTNASMYEQISWLLVPALACIVLLFFKRKIKCLSREQYMILVLWSLCLLPMIIFFDIAGFFHRYYLAMMAPAISCLTSILAYTGVNSKRDIFKHIIISVCCITFLIEIYFVLRSNLYILLLLMIFCFIFAFLLWLKKCPMIAIFVSLIVAPFIYSFYPMFTNINSTMPAVQVNSFKNHFDMGEQKKSDDSLREFLLKNKSSEKYFLIVSNCRQATDIILNTDLSVIAINGFEGKDQALPLDKLQNMIKDKQVKYYMIADDSRMRANDDNDEINKWVKENCELVYTGEKYDNFSGKRNNRTGIYKLSG